MVGRFMLTTLRVKNLALVENVRMDFQPGLNVITGETGAGKSILVGALALLLGDRADRSLIRAGEDACGAEAEFQLVDASRVDAVLEEVGLPPCDHGQLIVRRIVKASGAGQILVNDSAVTLQALKRIGDVLVDMHGPHDHQSLLSPAAQLSILDAFGQLAEERTAYENVYRRLQELERGKAALTVQDGHVEEQIDLLAHRVQEIEEARLEIGEEEKIAEEHRLIGSAQRILELAGGATQALSEGEGSAFDRLAEAQKALSELVRLMPEAKNWHKDVVMLTGQLQEISSAVTSAVEAIPSEPVRMQWLDNRLAIYARLKSRYGPTVEEVLQKLGEARARLKDLQTRGEQLAALEEALGRARKEVEAQGRELSRKRKAVAGKLARAITRELQALGFEHGAFSAELSRVEPGPAGMDSLEFGFAPNVGEPARPLRDIASSGEISRVMLATKAVLAEHDRIPVLVFDEIDANLGGEMGLAVGQKLADVAKTHQVISITHLPQVAVCGQTHFAVAKFVRDNRTYTEVMRLAEEEDRVHEVARMLGGKELTRLTLDHAREMLSRG
jgi:DNA repair protein RecN (Recombination protein N)